MLKQLFKFTRQEKLEETIDKRVKLNPWNKTGTGIKILTPNKLLTRLPLLLAQTKTWNNSYLKVETKSGKYCIFCMYIIRSPKNSTKVKSNHYNSGREQTRNNNGTKIFKIN